MKGKKRGIVIASIIALTALVITSVAFGDNDGIFSVLGKLWGQSEKSKANEQIVAKYKDITITQADVDNQKALDTMGQDSQEHNQTDQEIINGMIIGQILIEEAECKGLSATEKEVEALFSHNKENYANIPEITAEIDSFCINAGMTIDEYFEMIREQLPHIISR